MKPAALLKHLPGLLLCLSVLVGASPASAAPQDPAAIRVAVEGFLRSQTAGQPGKLSISVSTPAASASRPACQQLEPWLPRGQQLRGALSVGVRCAAGANWSLFVAAEVKFNGDWVVLSRPVSAGQSLTEEDLTLSSGELSAQPEDVILDPSHALGHRMRQALPAGATLRAANLRREAAVQAGQTVRLTTRGNGFSVSNEGRAMNNAERGQNVRVRLANGRIVSGIAQETGVVEVP
ncbi:flagellar basal body P-ring formation chaperone FlgA [Uliginosibacterium sp. H1]|uniref:flagellar basal body P-ring formation chaperone FlgA n=1 Tax=Uliginosibacterium sp. H1 TaxID=3114757 RepID=UPI002E194C11|nr:flagellar basal body P-ring formation chaperone FlgA [Uliginosibacterium sp. H1]